MDKELRDLERKALTGDEDALVRLKNLKERAGIEGIIPNDLFKSKSKIRPIDILRQQADKINDLSDNKLLAGVTSEVENLQVKHVFGIACMADSNLYESIFELRYPFSGFPIEFSKIKGQNVNVVFCEDVFEFKDELRNIFHSDEIKILLQTFYEASTYLDK
jgi:hypothetical protein